MPSCLPDGVSRNALGRSDHVFVKHIRMHRVIVLRFFEPNHQPTGTLEPCGARVFANTQTPKSHHTSTNSVASAVPRIPLRMFICVQENIEVTRLARISGALLPSYRASVAVGAASEFAERSRNLLETTQCVVEHFSHFDITLCLIKTQNTSG